MSKTLDSETILASLQTSFTGVEPPVDLLKKLGGWDSVQTVAPALVNDPLLLPLTFLVARDAPEQGSGDDLKTVKHAATALVSAVLASTDPGIFASGVDLICDNASLSSIVGKTTAAQCLTLATPPTSEEDGLTEASVIRRAVALEGAARLAVIGHGSKNKLLGFLEDIYEPQPARYAVAVTRTVAMAFDHWSPDDDVTEVIDILTGVTAPDYDQPPGDEVMKRNEEFCKDVAPDAAWALANISVAKALRLTSVPEICAALDTSLEHLAALRILDDRDDAEHLGTALSLLRKLLSSLPSGTVPYDAFQWDIEPAATQSLANRTSEFLFDRKGLNHWSGDRKIAVLEGWSRLADDLAYLKYKMSRDSFYSASVVLDDIVSIYSASRAYELTGGVHDAENVIAVFRPAITSGFASRAGLYRHLVDHTEDLKRRLDDAKDAGQDTDLPTRLATASQILTAARESLTQQLEPRGKPTEQPAEVPPLLDELLGSTPAAFDALKSVPQDELQLIEASLADRQAAADLDPDLIVAATRKRILTALADAEDFREDIVPAVTAVLDQLIKFVRQRLNSQKSSKPYLFDPGANEQNLHDDLYEWLSQGQFGSSTNVEVEEVGAGRVDIQIQFSGFHLYLELKADKTAVPIKDKAAYIKQTVSYQASDVRIGFLVVLRMTPPKDKSPSGHLSEYVSHTSIPINDGEIERHVVMLEIPGNQTKPSSAR